MMLTVSSLSLDLHKKDFLNNQIPTDCKSCAYFKNHSRVLAFVFICVRVGLAYVRTYLSACVNKVILNLIAASVS